jgi:hypothetical protein
MDRIGVINALIEARGYRSYLEIGVATGDCLAAVRCAVGGAAFRPPAEIGSLDCGNPVLPLVSAHRMAIPIDLGPVCMPSETATIGGTGDRSPFLLSNATCRRRRMISYFNYFDNGDALLIIPDVEGSPLDLRMLLTDSGHYWIPIDHGFQSKPHVSRSLLSSATQATEEGTKLIASLRTHPAETQQLVYKAVKPSDAVVSVLEESTLPPPGLEATTPAQAEILDNEFDDNEEGTSGIELDWNFCSCCNSH